MFGFADLDFRKYFMINLYVLYNSHLPTHKNDFSSYSSLQMLQYNIHAVNRLYTEHNCIHLFTAMQNASRPKQNGRQFPDDNANCIFLNKNMQISSKVSLKFVLMGPVNNNWALSVVQFLEPCSLWLIYSSTVIARSNLRYYHRHCDDNSRIKIRLETHIRHPIARLKGELWVVYCEEMWENWPRYNGTALYVLLCRYHHTQ